MEELTGVGFATISSIERGHSKRPALEVALPLLHALEIPLAEIMASPATDRGVSMSPAEARGIEEESEPCESDVTPRRKKSTASI